MRNIDMSLQILQSDALHNAEFFSTVSCKNSLANGVHCYTLDECSTNILMLFHATSTHELWKNLPVIDKDHSATYEQSPSMCFYTSDFNKTIKNCFGEFYIFSIFPPSENGYFSSMKLWKNEYKNSATSKPYYEKTYETYSLGSFYLKPKVVIHVDGRTLHNIAGIKGQSFCWLEYRDLTPIYKTFTFAEYFKNTHINENLPLESMTVEEYTKGIREVFDIIIG